MGLIDIVAGAAFVACWLIYEPLLARMNGGRGHIKIDMRAVREGWVRRLLARDNRIVDSNLLGHQLSSASFFASTNLLVIAAASGLLFGGETMLGNLGGLILIAPAPVWLLEVKIAVVVVVLSLGLLDFIWAIRQLNYCLALFGAAPEPRDSQHHEAFVRATTSVLNPAYNAFNRGVRAYYFALAGAAWIVSGLAMLIAIVAAFALLVRRQTSSEAALGLREARRVLEEMQRRPD
ncbi:hypothetical protein U91I_01116 [alpha proteobacterium U9-1i]|nr:hypothetical protein U91I_01116 [alpha proteobacterium U9-1i]